MNALNLILGDDVPIDDRSVRPIDQDMQVRSGSE